MITLCRHFTLGNLEKILLFLVCILFAFAQEVNAQSLPSQPSQTNQQNAKNDETPDNNATPSTNLPEVGTPEYKLEAEKGLLFKTCGEQYPYGCPEGSNCYRVTKRESESYTTDTGSFVSVSTSTKEIFSWECLGNDAQIPKAEKPEDPIYELREEGSLGMGTITRDVSNTTGAINSQQSEQVCDSSGNCKYYRASNATCEIGRMKLKYQSNCYSCLIVKTLLSEFMKIGDKTYSLCRDAAVKILFLCSALWIAFFVLKNVSSFTSIEPASFVNQLLTQFFKIVVAYAIIVSGTDTFITYIVNPIMDAGADYGLAIIQAAEQTISTTPSAEYAYDEDTSFFSADVLNKILALNQGIDRIVSNNLVIGHGLTCHATHAGLWKISMNFFTVYIVNLWIWLCGAVIWFLGFMMTLAIAYYLVDISFKIGIAIIIFPITIALWPFSYTKNRVQACISTIFMSAATFAFLALTASYATLLISASLRDITTLEQKLKDGDTQWISDTFDIAGPYFLIILFAFLYSLKLIQSTIPAYVSLFFSGGIAAKLSPMHKELTRMTDAVKKKAMGAGSYVKDVATHQGGKAVKGLGKGLSKIGTIKFVQPQQNSNTDKNQQSSTDNSSPSNNPAQTGGAALKMSGRAVETAGKGVETAGKGISAAGKGVGAAGKGISAAGTALSATGIGAIIGVPLKVIGAATQAAGKGIETAGKATQTAGKAMKQTGKALKETGKAVQSTGKQTKQSDGASTQNESKPKQSDDASTQNEDKPKQSDDASTQNEDKSKQSDDASTQNESKPKQSDDASTQNKDTQNSKK